jgi:hypothetical protein
MRRRILLRAAALALVVVGIVAGLTVYLSTEEVPLCYVGRAPAWRPPSDSGSRRFEVVFADRAACFFAIDDEHKLVGALRLPLARGIATAAPLLDDVALRTESGVFTLDLRTGTLRRGGVAPFPSDTLTVPDEEHGVMYVTRRGFLGFRVLDLRRAISLYDVSFQGFTWNPEFGPNPPSHGLSLAPDRPELWVLDAPNSTVHVFDVSALPSAAPRQVEDIRLSEQLSGEVSPCPGACERIGFLQHSSSGRYVYVGDAGDVIDTRTRQVVTNLEALHNSRVHLEVAWVNGRPVFPNLSNTG